MKVPGTCPNCKRDDAPIEVLEIGEENQYRGRCLTCGLAVEGDLLLRTVIETLSHDEPAELLTRAPDSSKRPVL
jgi:hypothetical protein